MRPLSLLSFPFALLTAFTACAGGPSPDFASSEFQPAPLMESARIARPVAVTQSSVDEILVTFTDQNGRRRTVGFRCTWTTDSAHDLLAAACVQQNFTAAHAQARNVLCLADLDTTAGIEACQQLLRTRLDETLFPCGIDGVQAHLTGIEWTTWDVR
ncbi:MAG: hypothetical protein JNK15_19455 [Planctomycetes bacterium]|nr:hypothetical protein [Planctomycetota bacterium]